MTANSGALQATLAEGVELFRDLGFAEQAQRLQFALERMRTDSVRVLFIGEFGRGKSTLLNALLGKPILAASPLPTPTVNIVRWAATPAAYAERDGDGGAVDLDALAEDAFTRVELYYPLELLREQVELVELPDQSAFVDAAGLQAELAQADLVVVVLSSDALYSSSEHELVEQIKAAGHRRIMFVCTALDRIPTDEIERIQRAAYVRIPANQDRIFFVSSTQALAGNADAQVALAHLSRALQAVTGAECAALKAEHAQTLLRGGIAFVREQQDTVQREQAQTKQAADAQIRRIRDAYDALGAARRRVLGDVDDFQESTGKVVQDMTAGFVRELSLKIEPWLATYAGTEPEAFLKRNLQKAADEWQRAALTPYLHQQLKLQRAALDASIGRYQECLSDLSRLLPDVMPDAPLHVALDTLRVQTLHLPNEVKIGSGGAKAQVPLTQMPEVMALAAVSFAAFALVRPFILGVPLGLTGVGVAAFLASRRMQGSQTSELSAAARQYAADMRMQADPIARSIWLELKAQLDVIRDRIDATLKAQVERVGRSKDAELARLQQAQAVDPALQARLEALTKQLTD